METTQYRVRIKDLPEDERPLERLYKHGPQILKTSELIAIIIRTGTENATAVQVGEQLLQKYDGNLKRLANDNEIQIAEGIKGMGKVKASQIMAAFELGRRMAAFFEEKPNIGSPADVARIMMPSMRDRQKEILYVLCLDTKNNVIKQRQIFEGSLNASIIHPREVFRFAVEEAAASIILVHNHPSGDPTPSQEDVRATTQLIEAGNYIQIPVVDHVIIGDGCYISLKEEGLI
ncbi:MAG: DNA repair protein RadC [Candidatus Poribacteria bacterium]|nr:DNA repair protein RadC [Candidatus Poribacteria bacterium]